MNWRLNKIQYPVHNLGPGRRIGIWVQGCSLACAGCVNRTLWSAEGGAAVAVTDVFNWLASLADEFDGVTISGGEPFEQYEPLIAFLHLVKTRTALDVYCFSGFYLEELNEKFPDRLFYRYLDYLVDGRYVAGQHEDRNAKGSSNQTLYRFANGVAARQAEDFSNNRWSLRVGEDETIYMAGIPKNSDLNRISRQLAEVGIEKKFR